MKGCNWITRLLLGVLCVSALLQVALVHAEPLQRQKLGQFNPTSALEQVDVSEVPDWVLHQAPNLASPVPTQDIQDGSYFLLSDFQYHAGDNAPEQQYRHFAVKLVNTNGADNYSQLNFIFDPAYERLKLHAVTVHRDGQTQDKLTDAEHTMERASANEQVFDGSMQLRLLLSDIRVGDVIEYSYTVTGTNPVFAGHFYHRRPLQWNVPIAQQLLRIVWHGAKPLQVQITPNTSGYQLEHQQRGDQHVYQIALTNTAAVSLPNGVPAWYEPRAQISFSDLASWQDVAQWGRRLFADATQVTPAVNAQAEALAQGKTSTDERIVAALDFVQTQIRYLALEMGVNSHLPAKADITLLHRFGDCKDKSALLVALLRAMKIDASPVLVNTDIGERLDSSLPSAKVFNHAIVMIDLDGQPLFVDPTIGVQKGALAQRYAPYYGYGLVLVEDSQALVNMPHPQTAQIDYKEAFDLRQGAGHAANYQVETRYVGGEAERLRQRIATEGVAELQRSYQNFFTEQYGDLSATPLSVDDSDSGLAIVEQYQLENPWQENDKAEEQFFVSENQIPLQLPKNREPRPYALKYPLAVNGEITLKLNKDIDWSFANETQHEQNPFFEFHYSVNFDAASNELVLNYHYQALASFVPEEQFKVYLAAVERVADFNEFGIVSYPPEQSVEEPPVAASKLVFGLLYFLAALVLLTAALVNRLSVKKTSRYTVFYPTSMAHTLLFMWLTGGIYGIYWCYRNWRAQHQDKPQYRWLGILLPLIYMPLTLKIAQLTHSSATNKWLLRISALLTPILVCFMLWQLGWSILLTGWLILSLLMSPLVSAVNQLNWQQGIAVPRRWRTYHSLLALALLPGYIWFLAA